MKLIVVAMALAAMMCIVCSSMCWSCLLHILAINCIIPVSRMERAIHQFGMVHIECDLVADDCVR